MERKEKGTDGGKQKGENGRTRELRTMRKSVTSAPAWPPKPKPAVPIALGADQSPFGSLAMTRPEPARAESRKPALATVKMAKPLACWRTGRGPARGELHQPRGAAGEAGDRGRDGPERGMTWSRPLLAPSTNELTREKRQALALRQPVWARATECCERTDGSCVPLRTPERGSLARR